MSESVRDRALVVRNHEPPEGVRGTPAYNLQLRDGTFPTCERRCREETNTVGKGVRERTAPAFRALLRLRAPSTNGSWGSSHVSATCRHRMTQSWLNGWIGSGMFGSYQVDHEPATLVRGAVVPKLRACGHPLGCEVNAAPSVLHPAASCEE